MLLLLRTAWTFAASLCAKSQEQQPPAQKRGHAGKHDQAAANIVIKKPRPYRVVQSPTCQRDRQQNDQAAARFGFGRLRHFVDFGLTADWKPLSRWEWDKWSLLLAKQAASYLKHIRAPEQGKASRSDNAALSNG
jgi:hypothetical protein